MSGRVPTHLDLRSIPDGGLLMTRLAAWASPVLLLLAGFGVPAEPTPPPYGVLKKIKVGGDGGWDYLTFDTDARRLYIARSTRVLVLDVDKNKVVGTVPNTPGVHGVALVPRRHLGFASNGGDSTVTIFDLRTLREKAKVKVGRRPDAIVYDPASDRVFTFNAGSSDATALAAADGKVAGTVKLGGRPEFAVADEKGMIYVNLEDKAEVVAFDAKKLAVKHRWPWPPARRRPASPWTAPGAACLSPAATRRWSSSMPTAAKSWPRRPSAREPTPASSTRTRAWPTVPTATAP
jgi:hypothetical protein